MNIVFDLSGVVVCWEPLALLARTFDDPATCQAVHAQFIAHNDWLELDRGTMAPALAVARAAQRLGLAQELLRRFLDSVPPALVPFPETLELLCRLKARGHGLYCLSNMHFASIAYLEATYDFWPVFTGKVISCRVQLCKPEAAIYAHLLETFHLNALDTIFIDDVEANLAAARRFGIGSILFTDAAQCASELQALGCL